jgi:hypothetical protein
MSVKPDVGASVAEAPTMLGVGGVLPQEKSTGARMSKQHPIKTTSVRFTIETSFIGAVQSHYAEDESCCIGGHFVSPYEQKTQQSCPCGRSNASQLVQR